VRGGGALYEKVQLEVEVLRVIIISRGCFERCCSNKKTPPYHSNLSFARFEPGGRRCSVRPHTIRRPRLPYLATTVRPRESASIYTDGGAIYRQRGSVGLYMECWAGRVAKGVNPSEATSRRRCGHASRLQYIQTEELYIDRGGPSVCTWNVGPVGLRKGLTRPRLLHDDGAATRVGFFGCPCYIYIHMG